MTIAQTLHSQAIVIDAVCPLLHDPARLALYREGGLTMVAPTLATVESARTTIARIASWKRLFVQDASLVQVYKARDITEAKK